MQNHKAGTYLAYYLLIRHNLTSLFFISNCKRLLRTAVLRLRIIQCRISWLFHLRLFTLVQLICYDQQQAMARHRLG